MAILAYSAAQAVTLVTKQNPSTTQAVNANFYDFSNRFVLAENDFKIAIGVYDYVSNEPKNSPDYVRWVPQLVEDAGGVKSWKPLKFHTCNETDFAQFYPVAKRS